MKWRLFAVLCLASRLTALADPSTNAVAPAPRPSAPHTAKELPPGAGALMADATMAMRERDFAGAEQKYNEILRQDENNVYVLDYLAAAQFESSNFDACEKTVLRAVNLEDLRAMNLSAADLQRRGRHPELGSVTLSQLLAAWAAHDLTHLHQLSRVMAHQYRDAVGPWSVYLGVLQCAGHSASS